MNWRAMLCRAAEASFEKDIEALAAADQNACSCVDLPPAKIRELSKKILLLPHEGIVLLLSRYCFRLSPEEAEMFFQLNNARGRFRFYRTLLSSGMGLRADHVISDASFREACEIAQKKYLNTELEDAGSNKTGKSQVKIMLRQMGRAVAVAAVTLALLFGVSMATNAKFRERVITWIVDTYEEYSAFQLKNDGDGSQVDLHSYKPTYLPDGAELLNTVDQPEVLVYEYAIGESSFFDIFLAKADNRVYMDTEDAEVEEFEKDGMKGYFIRKDDWNCMCYERDGNFFSINGTIDMDELIKIAEGIKIK